MITRKHSDTQANRKDKKDKSKNVDDIKKREKRRMMMVMWARPPHNTHKSICCKNSKRLSQLC